MPLSAVGPYIEQLPEVPDVEQAFLALASRPHCLWLDSALRDPQRGRYSFLAADPFEMIEVPADGRDGLRQLAARLDLYRTPSLPDLPPFQGGAAGLFGYDLNRSLERVPPPRFDEFGVPALAIALYDVVLAIDHRLDRAWIISQGFPELDPQRRSERATQRAAEFRRWLTSPVADCTNATVEFNRPSADRRVVPREALAPQFAVPGPDGLTSNFAADDYRRTVQRVVDYIRAGDVFQVNLAQRLLFPEQDAAPSLYLRLRRRNAAPFAGYFDLGEHQIVSASPERFLSVRQGRVETRPIKGTRQRMWRPEADLYAGAELQQNEKDRAENVMIVDLLRNDLSPVCQPASVCVTQLCGLEIYQYVQHLVSVVTGQLRDGMTSLDLLRTAFPGGSITGAPKVRAMEIIAELEPTARGAYCGSLGYLGFDGTTDLSILIRTITAGRGWWQLPVGGGIVAQSDPQREYEETGHKATGLIRSLL
ncbi:MAG: anthranilate synthase component I family protein [Pirellulaceae bacterium]|nr:anthranilate synthase component I family protein [Pirellulaceae bacterium]